MQIYHFLQIDAYFDQIMSCGSRLVCIFTIDHVRMTEYSAKPRPSKKVATSTSGKTMLACISIHNLIQIYCVVQELLAMGCRFTFYSPLMDINNSIFGYL